MNEQELKIAEKIKELLCDSLGIEADVLTNDIPLFGDGIGLDSIDSLEMIAAIDKEFGVSMTGVGKEPFYNVESLAKYVAAHIHNSSAMPQNDSHFAAFYVTAFPALCRNLYKYSFLSCTASTQNHNGGTITMTDNKNRCVITGLGLVCAIGNSVDEAWKNAVAGVSGIKDTDTVDTKDCYSKLSAEVRGADLEDFKHADEMDKSFKALPQGGERSSRRCRLHGHRRRGRVSVIMGSCVGGVVSVEHYYKNGKPASDVVKMPISAIANQVARTFGAGGVVTNVANACAAGTISIAYACDLIRAGKADVVIAGGADAFASVPYAGFLSLHALAAQPCSPFNRCDGITLGEGSGVLIVESYEHAKARGAKIYCEVLGAGISSDAHHITAPRPDGEGQMNAIRRGLEGSGLCEKDIGYINAHGTGTAKNDEAEFLSLHTIFDSKNDDLSVSSTKAMVGHCLGAAGAIEAVFAVKALTDNTVPPTIGYSDEDLEKLAERAGNIDFRPNVSLKKELHAVMSNSFAFGGNNASIIFSKDRGSVKVPEKKEDVYLTGIGVVSPIGNSVDSYVEKLRDRESTRERISSVRSRSRGSRGLRS